MKECLDSIKRLHAAILVVSAALLVLAVTPNRSARYEAALKLLRQMPRLSRDPAIVEARKQSQVRREELFRRVDAAARGKAIALPVESSSEAWSPAFFTFAPVPAGDSLQDEQQFYAVLYEHFRTIPDPEVVSGFLQAHTDRKRQWRLEHVRSEQHGALFVWTSSVEPREELELSIQRGQKDPTGARSLTAMSDAIDLELLQTIFPNANEFFIQDEFEAIIRFASLDRELPGVWEEIREMTRSEAIRETEKRAQTAARSLSLFGVSVDEQLATFGGPVALWLALVYLVLHVAHVHRLAAADAAALDSYPWPPLFAGLPGAFSSAFALFLVPTVAAVRFAGRVREMIKTSEDDPARSSYVAALAFAVAVTGAAAHVMVRRLPRAAEPRMSRWRSELTERWIALRPVLPKAIAVEIPLRRAVLLAIVQWSIGWVAAMALVWCEPVIFARSRLHSTRGVDRAFVDATPVYGAFALAFAVTITVTALITWAGYRIAGSRQPLSRHLSTLLEVRLFEPFVVAVAIASTQPFESPVVPGAALMIARVIYLARAWYAMRRLHPLPPRRGTITFILAYAIPALTLDVIAGIALLLLSIALLVGFG